MKIFKLKEDNYFEWVVEAEAALCVKGLWPAVEEDEEFRALDAQEKKKKQREARGFLILCISPQLRNGVIAEDTPKKIWDKLRTRFCQQTNERKADLIDRLTSAEQKKGETIATFVSRVEMIQRRLKEEHSETISDSLVMGILLRGASNRFATTIEALRCLDNLTLVTVKDKLVAADERMRSERSDDGGGSALTTEGRTGDDRRNGARNDKRDNRRCYNCGKVGHLKRNCRLPRNSAMNSKSDVEGSRDASNGSALSVHASVQSDASAEKILVDTGATHHMCHDRSKFVVLRPSSIPVVMCGGGESHEVLGQGSIFVKSPFGILRLDDVLFVPTLTVNLFSGSAACRKGAKLVGLSDRLEVVLKCRVVLQGVIEDGLFRVDGEILGAEKVPVGNMRGCAAANIAVSADIWHKRLGHPSCGVMQKLQNPGVVSNLHVVGKLSEQDVCVSCIQAKQSRLPFPSSDSIATERLGLVHADVIGKMPCQSVGGSLWILTMMDDFSRYSEVVCLKSKADVASACWDVLQKWQRQTGCKVKVFRSDGGTEFLGSLTENFRKDGVIHQKSVRYTPQQNGRAERLNRTLLEKTRCLLFDANLPPEFWAEAVSTANYLRNLVPTSSSPETPFELFHGKVPDVGHLRVFGCNAHVQVPTQLRKKLDKCSVQGVFVGYEANKKAWRVMCPSNGAWKLHVSRDVQFIEHMKGLEVLHTPTADEDTVRIDDWLAQKIEDENVPAVAQQQLPLGGENEVQQQAEAAEDEAGAEENDDDFEGLPQLVEDDDDDEEDPEEEEQAEGPAVQDANNAEGRPQRIRAKPAWYDPAAYANGAVGQLSDEPKTLKEVNSRPDAELWEEAMQAELRALWEKGVYEWVSKPTHKKTLPARWVFKIKRDEKGSIEKYKARLVAKGFMQKAGVDYDDVSTPASSHVTLRLLLSIAAQKTYDVHQLDVKTAFLNGELDEEVYPEPPEGATDVQGRVWRLKKALYGLKQAAQAWHMKL